MAETTSQLLTETRSVESSNVERVGWREDLGLLVVFQSGDYVYIYPDAPRGVYEGLVKADSVGSQFHKDVKGTFEFRRQWIMPMWMDDFVVWFQLDESLEPGDETDRRVFIERVMGDWEGDLVDNKVRESMEGQVGLLRTLHDEGLLKEQ